MKKNNVASGITGTLLVLLLIASVILLNWVMGLLGDRFDLKADLTGGGVFSLSEESKGVVNSLTSDVTVTYATNAQNRNARYTEILEAFAKASPYITVQEVNIDTDPGFARKYQIQDYSSVVVHSEKTDKKRVISSALMEGVLSKDNGMDSLRVNYLESYVSAALRYTTSDDPLTVYLAAGHGETVEKEPARLDYLMGMLYAEGMTVRQADITTSGIPDDADILLIVGPSVDFTTEQLKRLDDYLERGGRVQIYASPSYELPNLSDYLMTNWGAAFGGDCVSDENDKYIAPTQAATYLMPMFSNHAMTDYFLSAGVIARMPDGEVQSVTIREVSGVEAVPLITTSDTGVTMDRENWAAKSAHNAYLAKERGKQNLCVYLRKNSLNGREATARLMLAGGDYLLFDRYDDPSSDYADKDFVIKSINFMSGVEDAPVSVASKQVVKDTMELLTSQRLTVIILVLVVLLPLLILGYGIYVYIRRKRL